MFLRNSWYVAAWTEELGDGLLGRRLLDEAVLLYRLASGDAVAIGDRCPHRFAPLHLGRKVGDQIQCGYHGLLFNAAGACVGNPQASGLIPTGTSVKQYPLIERHGLLWLWMGNFDSAEAASIPDLSFLQAEAAASTPGYLHVRANYQLATDNLMDLSHAVFLHEETLGRLTPGLADGDLQVSRRGEGILAAIRMRDVELPTAEGPVDQWLDMTWSPPGVMVLDIGHIDRNAVRPDHGRRAVHIVTPETKTTSHYFFRNAGNGMPFVRDPFADEDEPMLAACQEMMKGQDFWSLKPAILSSDAGAIRVRRHLDKLIRNEGASVEAA